MRSARIRADEKGVLPFRGGPELLGHDTVYELFIAITLLTAESKPDEMEIIINVIMHLLSDNNE